MLQIRYGKNFLKYPLITEKEGLFEECYIDNAHNKIKNHYTDFIKEIEPIVTSSSNIDCKKFSIFLFDELFYEYKDIFSTYIEETIKRSPNRKLQILTKKYGHIDTFKGNLEMFYDKVCPL